MLLYAYVRFPVEDERRARGRRKASDAFALSKVCACFLLANVVMGRCDGCEEDVGR